MGSSGGMRWVAGACGGEWSPLMGRGELWGLVVFHGVLWWAVGNCYGL